MSDITLEDIALDQGLDYRNSQGHRGPQIIIKECPKCHNDNWKVYANAENSLGNCFVCNTTFNLFKFVGFLLEDQGKPCSPRDIHRFLDDYRSKLGYKPTVKREPKIIVTNELTLPTSAALPYEDGWLPKYLLDRGIDGNLAKAFNLRYSSFGSNVFKDSRGKEIKQDFSNRIIIPVYDLEGHLVTYQGRDTTGTASRRYVFAGGLPGTGRYLYMGHYAKAVRAHSAVLCEGPFDVIATHKAIKNHVEFEKTVALGSFGKHLSSGSDSEDQISAFRKLKTCDLKSVTLMWDGEKRAYSDALEACALLRKIGLETKIAILPKDKDPGDLDGIEIRKCLTEAKSVTNLSQLSLRMNNPYL